MITSLTLSTRGGCRTSYYPPAILLELLEGALLLATLVDFLAESPFLLFGWVKGESRLSFSDSNGITVFYIGQLAPPPENMETRTMLSSTQFQHLLSTRVRPHTKRLLVLVDTCHSGHDSTLPSKRTTGPRGPVRTFDDDFGKVVAADGMASHLCLPCRQPRRHRRREGHHVHPSRARRRRGGHQAIRPPPWGGGSRPARSRDSAPSQASPLPSAVFSGAGICDLEDFFIGSRKACAFLVPFFLVGRSCVPAAHSCPWFAYTERLR